MKNICVITGTRAEYGLLRRTLEEIKESKKLNLKLVVTASHLSSEFGSTVNQIKNDRFKITRKLETLLSSDTPVGVSKTVGLGIIGFADIFDNIKPDLIILTGDRYEMLSAAIAAMFQNIPMAHIHGGENSEGAYDEAIRHSITKMASLHLVANHEYRKRVIQLGENPTTVHIVGGLGVDNIKKNKLLSKKTLEKKLKIKFLNKNLLITYHPETVGNNSNLKDFKELLLSLQKLEDTNLIFTMPNADHNSRSLIDEIKKFVSSNKNAVFFKSVGQLNYFSLVSKVDGVIGNSSSGISEVPSFKKPTINIGDRQKGRIKASNVIDCRANRAEITRAIKKIYSKNFNQKLEFVINPYGSGGASKKIIKLLEKNNLNINLKKSFYDINFRV